ncbi:MAG: flagellar hook-associated protein FlgK [Lachnospiraceae bacterium]|jgi:flagellar hook-associated protein 1 FlgK|nr:flagellar hook-associated protein FlgK [Lachnospiraceae bacterium]MCI9680311.1 flagellar hook-associated protein FlgK [Lachnospiraceae bacterium]
MMRSTFAGFTTATLALNASHRALEVTGQNIANINTPGYTRQRLDIKSLYLRGGEFYNSNPNARIGFGVEITGVSQLRDPFLDIQYRLQMAKLGTTDAQVAGYEKLANILDETDKNGIKNALSDLASQLQKLAQNPNSKEYDSMVRSSSQILLNLFHQNSTDLQEVRKDLTSEFRDTTIPDANKIIQNIAELNESIKNSEILGNPALELKDERNELIDELASYLPITVKYRDHDLGAGFTVEELDIYYTDADGTSYKLLSDNLAGMLSTNADGQPVQLYITNAYGKGPEEITNTIGDGVLKGTLDILNKSGGFDNPPSDIRGIGYYEKSLDSLVATFAETLNKLNESPKIDPATGKPEVDANGDPVMEKHDLFEAIDPNQPMSASNIKIADGWANGDYGITISNVQVPNGEGDNSTGETADENVLKMIKALSEDRQFSYTDPADPTGNPVDFYKGNFYNCFVNMENILNIDLKAGNSTLENKITVINQTADLKDSISGVSLDEEGINLLHYQQSYSAAARLMTTLDEALDKLINGTGVVGR